MIAIAELIVKGVRPLQHGWISLNLHIKPEDLTREQEELLRNYWSDGNSLACVLQEFQTEAVVDPKPKLRKRLALVTKNYSEIANISENTVVEWIYKKFNIESRKELTEEQLRQEIDFFQSGIDEIKYPNNF